MNEPKKDYSLPMHTAEHILNQTMIRMFNCGRAINAHIEKKKSKCDYRLPIAPSDEQVQILEQKVNEIIRQNMDVTAEFVSISEVAVLADISKLPDEAKQADSIRLIKVGDYDTCACIGAHVQNTQEIGEFKLISHDYANGIWRVRFKII
jgi:alanyl-tRNA synthetase